MMTSIEFSLLANLISRAINVKCIQSNDKRGVWKANPVKKIIYYPQETHYTDCDLGYLIHEVGHLRFSRAMPYLESGDNKKFIKWVEKFGKSIEQIFGLVNAFEDIRIDEKMRSIYKGANKYLRVSYKSSLELDYITRNDLATFNPSSFKNFCNASWLHYCKYYLWDNAMKRKIAEKYLKRWRVKKKVYEAINKTKKINVIKEILKCKNTQDICNLIIKDILEIYLPLCDDERKEKGMTKQEFKKLMKKMLKDLIKELKKIEKKIKKDRKEKGKGKSIKIGKKEMDGKLTERIKIEQKGKKNKKGQSSGTPGGVGYSKEIFNRKIDSIIGISEKELLENVNLNLAGVRKAMSILKDKEIKRYEGNYESGKLQNRKLYKLKTGTTKIFTRKTAIEKDNKDMVFGLLVDESGSMTEPRMRDSKYQEGETHKPCQNAAIATTLLGKALEITGKKFTVIGFNRDIHIHKKFNKKMNISKMTDIAKNAWKEGNGCNNDGWAINEITKMLEKRPEKNKILIVLSDGQPAPSPSYRQYDLRIEAKKAEKVAKVYGIGINSKAVENYYRRHIIIHDPAELGKTLTKIFKENIGKRVR